MTLLLLILLAAPAQARDTIPPDTLRPVPLPGIVVEVLRTPLSREESPLAVSVLTGTELGRGTAGSSLEEAIQALPGLQIQNRFNPAVGERIVLRGMGARAQFGVRGVRILVDGIPATLPDGQSTLDHLDLPALGRVEVLRGPASTLYGNGAGGVLRFRTRAPPLEPLRQEASVLAGSFGLVRFQSITEGTAGETGYLLSAAASGWDGFRSDPVREGERYGASSTVTLNGHLLRPLGEGTLAGTLSLVSLDAENPGSLGREGLESGDRPAWVGNVRQRTGKEVLQLQAGSAWRGALRGAEASLSVYGIRRELTNPIPSAVVELERRAGGVRGELSGRSSLGRGELRWTAGVEGEGQWDRRRNLENLQGTPGEETLDQDERVLSAGAFVQGILAWERAHLLAGLRTDRLAFRVSDRRVAGDDPDDSGSRSMGAASPSLGGWLRLAPWLNARASLTTLYQTPTTSELANRPSGAGGFNPELDPTRGRALEGGLQAGLGSRARLEVVAFRTDLRDELIPFEVPNAPGRVFFRNGGRSRYRGLEVAAAAALPGGVRLRGAYTWTEARYREYAPEGEDLAGNRIPGVAPHRWDGVLAWEPRWGGDGSAGSPGGGSGSGRGSEDGVAGTGGQASPASSEGPSRRSGPYLEIRSVYQSGIPVDDANTGASGAFALLELRGGTGDLSIGLVTWSPFFGVTNLLDRRYVSSVVVNAFGGRFFEPGPGRGFYLGVSAALGG